MLPLLVGLVLLAQEPQSPPPAGIHLVVLTGGAVTNRTNQRSTTDTIVLVENDAHQPVPGAAVVFLLSATGPGGTFITGSKSAVTVTDANGRAVMPRIFLNASPGKYQVRVHASQGPLQADTIISQNSISRTGLSTGAIAAIIGAIAAAGAGVAVVASRGKGSSSGSGQAPGTPAGPSGSIGSPSSPTMGPPH